MAITALPPAPNRTDSPDDFVSKADTFVAALPPFVTEMNTEITNVNTDATAAAASATAASSSAAQAAASATQAAASANFVGNWSALTGALNAPATVYHSNTFWQLLTNLADVTASEPSPTNSDWAVLVFHRNWVAKSANYTAVAGDNLLCDTSGGAFTITLPSAPKLNDEIAVYDAEGTFNSNSLYVGATGQQVAGVAENFNCNIRNRTFIFFCIDAGATKKWGVR